MATTLKRKVTLRTKVAEEPVSAPVSPHLGGGQENSGNGKKWGIAALIVVVLAIVALFLLKNNKSEELTDVVGVESKEVITPEESTTSEPEVVTAPVDEVVPAEESTVVADEVIPAETEAPAEEIAPAANPEETVPATPAKTTPKSEPVKEETTKVSRPASVALSGSLEDKARQVIRGDFGNGAERREKLGAQYYEIQSKVNEMYRAGLVR